MKITKLFSLAALLLASTANAATVSLVSGSAFVDEGATFDINLVLDATGIGGNQPGAFNGNVTIEYDPALVSFNGFSYNSPASFNFGPMMFAEGSMQRIALDFTGAESDQSIGAYSFTALASEGTEIAFSIIADLSAGFANEDPTNLTFEPDFENTSVSVVPLPASAWLMLSALGLVAARVRRRT